MLPQEILSACKAHCATDDPSMFHRDYGPHLPAGQVTWHKIQQNVLKLSFNYFRSMNALVGKDGRVICLILVYEYREVQ